MTIKSTINLLSLNIDSLFVFCWFSIVCASKVEKLEQNNPNILDMSHVSSIVYEDDNFKILLCYRVQDYKVLFQVNSVDFDDSASETESSSGQGSSPANDDDSAEAGSPDFADNLDEAGLPDSSDDLANVGSPEPADEESQDVASENSSSPKEKRRLTVVNAAAERYINRLDKRIRKFLINSANEETALFSTHAHKKNELRKLILYADLTPEEMKPYISP